jgi:hypothetical protein
MNPLHLKWAELAAGKKWRTTSSSLQTEATVDPMLVSTRQPKGAPKFGDEKLTMSHEKVAAVDSGIIPKIADSLRRFHIAGPEQSQPEKPEELISVVGQRMQQNLQDTLRRHGSLDPTIITQAAEWYPSAHGATKNWAQRYNLNHDTTASVIAIGSPQMEWTSNAAHGERMIHTVTHDVRQGKPGWTPRMSEEATRILEQDAETKRKSGKDPEDSNLGNNIKAIMGKGWHDIVGGRSPEELTDTDYEQLGTWVRIHSTANHPEGMREPLPHGGFGEFVKTAKGQNARVQWQSSANLGKMVKVLMADQASDEHRRQVHNEVLGENPKVRSFFNNIKQPNAPTTTGGEPADATIDIHTTADAIGRGDLTSTLPTRLRKTDYQDKSFTQDFGGMVMSGSPKSVKSGNVGVYGVVGDAVREVAKQQKVFPRALQSMGWVGRKLDSEQIQASPETSEAVRQMHRDMRSGALSFDDFRTKYNDLIMGLHKKSPRTPSWKGQTAQSDSSFLSEEAFARIIYKLVKTLNENYINESN